MLSRRRQHSQGIPQPIPTSEVLAYARRARWTQADVEEADPIILALDEAQREHWAELNRRNEAARAPTAPRARNRR